MDDTKATAAPPALDRGVFNELRDMVGDDMCAKLIKKFAREVDERLRHIQDGDRSRIAADAHALISPAGSLGFTVFSSLCREVESTARQGGDLEPCLAALHDARGTILSEVASLL